MGLLLRSLVGMLFGQVLGGWLVAGSDKDGWQSVVGSLIQVFSLGIVDIIKGTTRSGCWSWDWVGVKSYLECDTEWGICCPTPRPTAGPTPGPTP
jgi:hypothetical protein